MIKIEAAQRLMAGPRQARRAVGPKNLTATTDIVDCAWSVGWKPATPALMKKLEQYCEKYKLNIADHTIPDGAKLQETGVYFGNGDKEYSFKAKGAKGTASFFQSDLNRLFKAGAVK